MLRSYCAPLDSYHQCAPGTPDLLAAQLVEKLNAILTSNAILSGPHPRLSGAHKRQHGAQHADTGTQSSAGAGGGTQGGASGYTSGARRYIGVADEAKFGRERGGWPPWVWSPQGGYGAGFDS